tara:strand:- start:126 stop:422 length:297 start_codon:yes stop_codon:yes gene_type:complete
MNTVFKEFKEFIETEFEGYVLINLTNKLNSRNIGSYADIVKMNEKRIYLIEKKPTNIRIFRDMNHHTQKYMFLNKEKVFVLSETNIKDNLDNLKEFLS